MSLLVENNFCDDKRYRLYRTVSDIISPTISKRNISNYEIIVGDDLLPILAFYPKRVSNIKSVLIFLAADGKVSNCYGKYVDICSDMAKKADTLVITIDYFEKKLNFKNSYNAVYKTISYLVSELVKNNIDINNISLMADSVACNLLLWVVYKLRKDSVSINKVIFCYPIINMSFDDFNMDNTYISMNENTINMVKKYITIYNEKIDFWKMFDNFPRTLIITGDIDSFKNEGILIHDKLDELNVANSYFNIKLGNHGFLNGNDEVVLATFYNLLNDFLKNND